MYKEPLTPEESDFAAHEHRLVYKFLISNHLPEEEYYDIVIFGYLKSVQDYSKRRRLKKYAFSTIAWKNMSRSLSAHRKKLKRRNKVQFVSIHVGLSKKDAPLEETLPYTDTLMQQLEMKLILEDIANKLSKQQTDIISLKMLGYGMRYIARSKQLSLKDAKELLEDTRITFLNYCNEENT